MKFKHLDLYLNNRNNLSARVRATRLKYLNDLGYYLREQYGWAEEEEVDFAQFFEARASDQAPIGYEQIDAPFLQNYINYRENQGVPPRMLHEIRTALKDYFNYLVQTEKLRWNPTLSLDLPRMVIRLRKDKYLTVQEGLALLLAAARSPCPVRNFFIILLGLVCALRPGEIAQVKVSDLSYGKGLHVGKVKTDPAVVGLPKEIKALLYQFIRVELVAKQPGDSLFTHEKTGQPLKTKDITRIVQDLANEAGICKRITGYWLRHTCATQMLASGALLHEVSNLLRHKRQKTTLVYAHFQDRQLRELVSRNGLIEAVTKKVLRNVMQRKVTSEYWIRKRPPNPRH